ncbi:sodium:solute symporter family protein [Paraglaciecola hydrolytica]|uniref:Sodium:solute symporter n=1 Tax=Paraglaciecola hydrolytica TaxID=1799789 RepID=A0A148KN92_9ALTE|nr:sodium:solute symporter family protein [Paraglaciecola hydrolytica]KXI27784.1 sodium:solute symporter [Paraglaciecola hydrolytica]
MNLSLLDLGIIVAYLVLSLGIGFWISKRASRNIEGYFLGGKELKWYYLGLSNASGMFDISGTMWMVYLLFIYGLKSIFIPWLWPAFNQIFMLVFLSIWLRRSGVMTGAEWIRFRFGDSQGAKLSHIIVVVFALVNVLGFLAYSFIGIGKFSAGFMPWQLSSDPHLNEVYYGLILTFITMLYVVKGGMYSVVITEVVQFFIMTIACVAIGIIAMQQVSPEMLAKAVPQGWDEIQFGWTLNLDWSAILPAANSKIAEDGYSMFSIFMMLVIFKGVLQSMAGPAPNYDMQRVLSARSPTDAAKMSWFVSVVLLIPRYMMITGLAILALVFFNDELNGMGPDVDFEQILPFALANYVPSGLLGLVLAGLLATFMSTFAATTNAAPAYVVNDIYKRYINPNAPDKTYVYLSYIISIVFVVLGTAIGLFIPTLNGLIMWIVSALYGGYTAANVLKWYWWRFNGYGYFYGMLTGIVAAIPLMFTDVSPLNAFPALFLLCLIGCVLGTLLTPADDMQVLKNFYLKTRPWGWWQPVLLEIQKEHPNVRANTYFKRDMANVVVGIIWHSGLIAAPIFLVIQQFIPMTIALAVVIVCSVFLKVFWWNTLEDYPADMPAKLV